MIGATAYADSDPGSKRQRFFGKLVDEGDGTLSGRVYDLGRCWHEVTLDAIAWKFEFPSADTCGDPIAVPDLIVDLSPQNRSNGQIYGVFENEPVCWLAWGEGNFSLSQKTDGSWWFVLDGARAPITYGGCYKAANNSARLPNR
jgi:hypothetical protein